QDAVGTHSSTRRETNVPQKSARPGSYSMAGPHPRCAPAQGEVHRRIEEEDGSVHMRTPAQARPHREHRSLIDKGPEVEAGRLELEPRSVTRHASPAARAIRSNPDPTMTAPIARATRSPAGARRSTVMAVVTRAIARRSMTPMTSRIAVRPAQQ